MAAGGDNEVNVKFGATIDDFKSKMGEVSSIFKNVVERFGALAAVVAGGAAFKSVIDETNKLNGEAIKLSRTLGITGEEAGTLNTALGDIYTDADTYTGAFLKFNRALRTNSDELRNLGVDVDGLKNGQKDSNQVFMEAIQIVGQYKPGIDQTQVAMKLFGRSVDDVHKLMKLNAQVLADAKKKNQELNLVITEEGVAATKKYKAAMNDVGDVLSGLKKTIGEEVMPIFTESAEQLASIGPDLVAGTKAAITVFVEIWQDLRAVVGEVLGDIMDGVRAVGGGLHEVFGGEAPSAMQIFRNALGIVQAAFIGFRIGFQELVNLVKTGLQVMGSFWVSFAAVGERALHLDFAGAKAAWQEGVAERARILSEGVDKAIAIATKGQADLQKALVDAPQAGPKVGTPKGAPAGGTKTADIGKEDKGNGGEKLAAALALKKAALEAEKNLTLEFLQEAQSIYDNAYKNNLLSIADYYSAKEAIEKKANAISIETKRAELQQAADAEKAAKAKSGDSSTPQDKAKYDTQALKFKTEQVKLQGEINVLEAQGNEIARKNAADRADAERQLADQLATIASTRAKAAADDQISAESKVLEQKKALRQIDAEDAFAVQKQLEEKSYRATLEQLQAKRALIHGDQNNAVKERAQLDADAEAAERQHQERLSEIDRAAELERSKYSIQAQQSTQSAFSTMVNDLLSGTKKISDVFRNFGISVANTFTNLIAQKFTDRLFDVTGVNKLMDQMVNFVTNGLQKIITRWRVGETQKDVATAAGAAKRTGVIAGEQTTAQAAVIGTTVVVETAEVAKTGAVGAGAAIRTTTETAAAATGKSLTIGGAIAAIGAKAWEAAAAVYAAIAAIPYVGPFLAPVAALAAGATVIGFIGNIASSEGGEMQVAQAERLNILHKDETVLPAPFARGLRQLVGTGGLSPITDAVDQIVNNLAPGTPRGAPMDPHVPPPAEADTSKVSAPPPVAAPAEQAVPLADPIVPLAPEQRPVPADAATSMAVSAPAPQGRSTPPAEAAPASAEPEPTRPNAPAGAALPLPAPAPAPAVANAPTAFPAQPVAADASAALVLMPPQPGQTAMPAPGRDQQVAAAGQETTPPAERQAAKTIGATDIPTKAKLSAPEVPQPAIASTAKPAESDVGKMVVRWLGDDQNRQLSEGRGAMSKLQQVAAGQPAEGGDKPWWRVPSSPLGRIQAAANGGAGAGGDDGGLGPRRESSAAPVQLNGTSAGDFFIAHTKDLLKVLNGAARNNRRPGA